METPIRPAQDHRYDPEAPPRPPSGRRPRERRSIKRRLQLGLLLLGCLLLGSVLAGWWTTVQSTRTIRATMREVQVDAELTARLSTAIVEECRIAARYVRTRDPRVQSRFTALLTEVRRIHLEMGRLRSQTTEEVRLVAEIRESLSAIEDTYARAHRLADLGRLEEARADEAAVEPVVDEVMAQLRRLHALKASKVPVVSEQLQDSTARGTRAMVLLIGGALLVAGAVARASAATLLRSLEVLLKHADELSRGHLAVRTEPESVPGEFRPLLAALNSAGESLTRLATAETALLRAEKLGAIGMLVSGVAHELNNPLAAILVTTEVMGLDATPEVAGDIGVIRAQAHRARDIVRGLLAVVRDEGPDYRSLDLAQVLAECVRLLEPQVEQRGITLSLAMERPLAPVTGDPMALQQVITNLVTNAADAAGAGGTVAVGARCEGQVVRITVEDTGPGIPAEALPRIFEPFFTTKEVGKGTGLGLSISQGIIQRHRGTLVAENRDGGSTGARMIVSLPCEEIPSAEATLTLLPQETARDRPAPSRSEAPRILLVDDEATIRNTLGRLFLRRKWRVEEASDGAEAFEKICRAEGAGDGFSVVISDLRMPGVTGMDLYRLLSEQHPSVLSRLIIATGDNVAPDAAGFLATADCPVVDKPFELAALIDVVASRLPEGMRHAA